MKYTIKFLYVYMIVGLQTVQFKLYYSHCCHRRSSAASDTAVPLGQHPISEAAEVTVELPRKFSATREKTSCCRYGNVLYHTGLEIQLLFKRELLDCYLVGVSFLFRKNLNFFLSERSIRQPYCYL
jgi:hypothetical protein